MQTFLVTWTRLLLDTFKVFFFKFIVENNFNFWSLTFSLPTCIIRNTLKQNNFQNNNNNKKTHKNLCGPPSQFQAQEIIGELLVNFFENFENKWT